jgi:hypothetical protein
MIAWVRMLARIAAIRGAVGSLSGRKLGQRRRQRSGRVCRPTSRSPTVTQRRFTGPDALYLDETGIWAHRNRDMWRQAKRVCRFYLDYGFRRRSGHDGGPVTRKLCCGTSQVVPVSLLALADQA